MDDRHRELLDHHRVILHKDLEPIKLLPYLAKVLDADDTEEVTSQPTRNGQADKLLEMLPRRGPEAFVCFIEALDNVQLHLAEVLRDKEDMERKMNEMELELGTTRTNSAKLRDELRVANYRLESEKNEKENLHKELEEHKTLLHQSRNNENYEWMRELAATKEHLEKTLEEKLNLEKSNKALEIELEKKTRWIDGYTTEVNNKPQQLVQRKSSYDEMKYRDREIQTPSRRRTYCEKLISNSNHSEVNGRISRQDINNNFDILNSECEEIVQCMKHSAENIELQKRLDLMIAERDLALDTCKQFEEKMRNRVDVGTDAMESNNDQSCNKCMANKDKAEEIKQQMEKEISRLTEEKRKAECTSKETIDKYEKEKKRLEQQLFDTSKEDFANGSIEFVTKWRINIYMK